MGTVAADVEERRWPVTQRPGVSVSDPIGALNPQARAFGEDQDGATVVQIAGDRLEV